MPLGGIDRTADEESREEEKTEKKCKSNRAKVGLAEGKKIREK